jgi:hypothetical protein
MFKRVKNVDELKVLFLDSVKEALAEMDKKGAKVTDPNDSERILRQNARALKGWFDRYGNLPI